MSLSKGQPRVRFAEHFNPGNVAALAYVPKTIAVQLEPSAAGTFDFWTAPAGVIITRSDIFCEVAFDGTTPTVELGTDGDDDALIDTTGFDCTTEGNWGTNIGSASAAAATGLYLPSGDTMRLTVTGTDFTQGKVSALITYFEKDDILARGVHFDL
jgi:hypothetical protein